MKPVIIIAIIGVIVVIAAGLLFTSDKTMTVSFDAEKVPTGFLDVIPSEEEISELIDTIPTEEISELTEIIPTEKEIIDYLTFDCAKQWDKYYDFYNKMPEQLNSREQSMKIIEESEELAEDFIKNRCASTVNDWAYKTQDENTVWYSGIDWEMMKEGEEKWHKENP